MATLLKGPEAATRSARSGDSSKSRLLRVAAAVSSALSILGLLGTGDLFTGLIFGLVGFALAAGDMRTLQGKSAGRQILAFSILALALVALLKVVAVPLGFGGAFVRILVSTPFVGAWVALYLAGYLHARKPNAEGEQAETSGTAVATQQNARELLATGALLTGSSIAIPAVMIAFVFPFNASHSGGEAWWPLVFVAIALSMGCAGTGIKLAARSQVSAGDATEAQSATAPRWVARSASWLLGIALLILMLAPIVTFIVTLYNDWDAAFIIALDSLGLVCMALAVWGVGASNPEVVRRWLRPLAVVAFVLALAGNTLTVLLFMLLGISL